MGRVTVALQCLVLAILACLTFSPVASANVLLNGSGSTFAFPLYSKWIDAFHHREPSIRVNYQSIGSGASPGPPTSARAMGPCPTNSSRVSPCPSSTSRLPSARSW